MIYLTGFGLLLVGSFLLGLILMVTGLIVLLKSRNRIAGILIGVVGLVFAFICPLAGLMYFAILRIQG